MRVLHIAQAAGGVEKYLDMLLKYTNDGDIHNILVCSQDYNLNQFKKYTNELVQVKMYREICLQDIIVIVKVRKLIKKYKPDIVYAHSSKAGAIARIANIGIKNKCIYNPHGWAFNMRCNNLKRKLYASIERLLSSFCDNIICISEAEKQSALEKKICKLQKLCVIYNGIDIDYYKNAYISKACNKESLNIPVNSFVIGMVGRVSQQKAPDIFIRSAEIIKKKIENAFFVIVGSGDMEADIEDYACNHDLKDSLLITGWVDEPMDYIEMFDVALLLSRWEGFGLVLAEYMIAQKPIVATNVDAIPNIITNSENGCLVDKEDFKAVADMVIKLHDDTQFADELKKNGLNTVMKKFDISRVARQHRELYRQLLNEVQ